MTYSYEVTRVRNYSSIQSLCSFSQFAQKLDFNTDFFVRLFTDIFLDTFWHLPDSFKGLFFLQYILEDFALPYGAGGDIWEIENKINEMINLQLKIIITIFKKDIIIITYYSHTPKLLTAIG
jgi:hypothetical protein